MTAVRNVVLLSVDALRADRLSCLGYDRETTPYLDALADESLLFESAYSASSHTREAVPALLTGAYPDEAVGSDFGLAAEPVSTRVNAAVDATAAFHSNPYVSRAFGYERGFDTFDDDLHLGRHKLVALAQRALDKLRNRHYARASEINDRSLSWLDSLADGESFFLWNHYMDPHGPYIPVEDHQDLYTDRQVSDREKQRLYKRAIRDPDAITDDERQLLIDLYDAEIRYTDAQIEAFLDALDERDLLAETLVIVTADHGDAFGEHGYYEHPRYLHEELTRVPLIVRTPDSDADRVQTPASTLDVVPTVLDQFGIEVDLPVVSLLGLGLSVTPLGVGLASVLPAVTVVTLGATAVGAVRRSRLPPEDRFRVPYRQWGQTCRTAVSEPDTPGGLVLSVLLVASILLAVGRLTAALTLPAGGETYTELYLLSENESGDRVAAGYPTEFTAGEPRPVVVGIENHEQQSVQYTVVTQLQRVRVNGTETTVTAVRELDRFSVELAPGDAWQDERSLAPTLSGDRLRVVYLLYRGAPPETPGQANAYRSVQLWVSVEETVPATAALWPNACTQPATGVPRVRPI